MGVSCAATAGLLVAALSGWAGSPPVTTESLLDDMTNLVALARFPSPPFTTRQFSSWDRAAVSPSNHWFANADSGQFLRVETNSGRREFVMADVEGPGAVVRIWSANPAGTVRCYLDGAETPTLEAPLKDLLGGTYPGLPPPLAGEASKGWNLYVPIPYARSCRITCDSGKFYYHVNVRTYPPGTPVETFDPAQLTRLAPRIYAVAARLLAGGMADPPAGAEPQALSFRLRPGDTSTVSVRGERAIAALDLRPRARDLESGLRGVVLQMQFDGEPCVEVPLGDFFGCGPGIHPFSTIAMGMTTAGVLSARWFMPFREGAMVRWTNLGTQEVEVVGTLHSVRHHWREDSLHFHAGWRAEFGVPTLPMRDWNYLSVTGAGVFVGASFGIDNPVRKWWGEGDEKIYVDGETFPGHFGTGTEDYFGYAWCSPQLFTHAYHAQPRCDGPDNYGRTSVNRLHILDRIPFARDFRFDMELWHWDNRCQVNLAVAAYWYGRPGSRADFPRLRPDDLVLRPMPPYGAARVPGVLEGESLAVVRAAATAEPQEWPGTSGERHLWWHKGVRTGDVLVVSFPAPKDGRYQVFARCLAAKDYGIHQLTINGRIVVPPLDSYHPEVVVRAERDLGWFDLKAAGNELAITALPANPAAEPLNLFGLDYLRLQAAE